MEAAPAKVLGRPRKSSGVADPWIGSKGAWLIAAILGIGAISGFAVRGLVPQQITLETMDETLGVHGFGDHGTCQLFARNASDPARTIERTFPCEFTWEFVGHCDGTTRLHEALYDREKDRVVRIPGLDNGEMEEWYRVRSHMFHDDAYRYTFDSSAGVFTPPPGAGGSLTVGLVTSEGRPDGDARLLVRRTIDEQGTATIEGIETVHWNGSYRRHRVQWHGHDQYRTEHADLWIDRDTGFALRSRVHVLVEMTPDQMLRSFDAPLPPDLHGGEPVRVLELTFETTPASTQDHAEQVRRFDRLMLVVFQGHIWGTAVGLAAIAAAWTARRRGG